MEKTALQTLIEKLEIVLPTLSSYDKYTVKEIIGAATELLPKERQQIEKAWDAGFDRGTYEACDIDELVVPKEKKDYFTQTYTQK